MSLELHTEHYTDKLPEHIPLYSGSLAEGKMPKQVKRAYSSWRSQKKRCYLKTDKQFKYYGAKGVKVRYSVRHFISWWIYWIDRIDFDPMQSTCGRLDHAKDYCFENVVMESKSQNSQEVQKRCRDIYDRARYKAVSVNCKHCGIELKKFDSIVAASKFLSLGKAYVTSMAQRKPSYGTKLTFTVNYL